MGAVHLVERSHHGPAIDAFGVVHDTGREIDGSWRSRSPELQWQHNEVRDLPAENAQKEPTR